MQAQATVLASWIRVICRGLEAEGVAAAPLLARCGLDGINLDDLSVRVPVESVARLWRLAVESTGDTAFGVKAARHSWITTFHALGYALIASSTLRDAFLRVERYFRIFTEGIVVTYHEGPAECEIRLSAPTGENQTAQEAIDASTMVLVRLVRTMLGSRHHSPLRIEFQRPAPAAAHVDTFVRAFRCPIRFSAAHTLIVWPRDLMDRPLESANPALLAQQEAVLSKLVEQLDRHSIVTQVKRLVINHLSQGEPSQDDIATQLQLSARTLQRRLAEHETTYSDVLDATRRELALNYLNDPGCTLKDVAFLLGFSDTGNFTRAFKRWTGHTPSDYRKLPR